jgi:hypothetical protein
MDEVKKELIIKLCFRTGYNTPQGHENFILFLLLDAIDIHRLEKDPNVEKLVFNKIRDEFLSLSEIKLILQDLTDFGYDIKIWGKVVEANWTETRVGFIEKLFNVIAPFIESKVVFVK